MKKLAGVDWGSVAQMLGGGAMLGTGAGAAVTFVKHLKDLQENAAAPVTNDPNVLYVDVPGRPTRFAKKASPNSNTAATFALSSLAGLVGTGLAYSTVRDVWNKRRSRELDNELAQAQHIRLGQLSGVKAASQYSMPTKMVGSGYLALLLTALGSAVVSNKLLDKRFPPIQSPTSGQPRKIVMRTVDPSTGSPLNADRDMTGVSPTAMEGVVRTQMADTKMASNNDVCNVVAAIAMGRADEVKELIKSAGVDGMLDAVKGASSQSKDPVMNNLAITWMCHDPLVSNAMAPIVASEFFKCATWTFDLLPKLASIGLTDDYLTGLVELTAVAAREQKLRPVLEKMARIKSAEEMHGMSPMKTLFFAGALKSILDDNQEKDTMSPANDQTGSDSEASTGRQKGIPLEVSDAHAQRMMSRFMPELDKGIAAQ